MSDWDDIRYFLAVARAGSLRAGAATLGVKHTTVLRRIAQLEERLGTRLFDRLPSGYRLTEAGAEASQLAEAMSSASHLLDTRIIGRDQQVRGPLRVTMTPMLASHLLMPDLGEFARLYPEIEIDLLSLDQPVNLTNREADVALRVVRDRSSLPLNLHALKGPEVLGGVYLAIDLLAAWRARPTHPLRWILKEFDGIPDTVTEGSIRIDEVPFRTGEAGAHIAAVRQGVGMTMLPCFIGDADPALTRAPGTRLDRLGTLWLLTQGETRRTKRVQLFCAFVTKRLASHAPLLSGRRPDGS